MPVDKAVEAREGDTISTSSKTSCKSHHMQYNRKIAIMGYPCVGKSSITLRFISGKFPDSYDPTIEDHHEQHYKWKNRDYALWITDTAGQHEHHFFPRCCEVAVDGFILVYAIDDRESFNIIRTIHDKIVGCFGNNVPVVIVGNKLDLQHGRRVVTREEGEALAAEWNAAFVEISARNLQGIENQDTVATAAAKPVAPPEVAEIFERTILAIEVAMGNMTPGDWPTTSSRSSKRCSIM